MSCERARSATEEVIACFLPIDSILFDVGISDPDIDGTRFLKIKYWHNDYFSTKIKIKTGNKMLDKDTVKFLMETDSSELREVINGSRALDRKDYSWPDQSQNVLGGDQIPINARI